jgi:toxin ParE1/3/4
LAEADRQLRLHPAAAAEIEAAFAWYAERSRPAADLFVAALELALRRIGEAPERWPRLRGSVRRYVVPRFPFSVVYQVQPEVIYVVAVAHHRRRPGFWTSRQG